MQTLETLNRPFLQNISCVLAGALLVTAFAPFNLFFMAPLSLAWLLFSWLNCTPRQAWIRGWYFGLGCFGFGVSWVFISIHRYGNANVLLAGFFTLAFINILALFPAATGWLWRKYYKSNLGGILLGFPGIWVIVEYIRSWIFTGFPWLLIGDSQTHGPFQGYLPIIGEYGVSFLTTLAASLIVLLVISSKKITKILALTFLILITLFGQLTTAINWTTPLPNQIKVSLVQGNIPQEVKWSPDYLRTILERYWQLSLPLWSTSDLIIWPEGSIPLPKSLANDFLIQLKSQTQLHHTQLILGLPLEADQKNKYYNGLIILGDSEAEYAKRHLVPFGEYVPLENWLRGLIGFFNIPMSDFIIGSSHQANLQVDHNQIAPFICYEIAYSELLRSQLPNATILLVISDDAWFGDSLAPQQHLQIAQARARQSGRYLLFSTNNGITAVINPKGQIISRIPQFQATVLTSNIPGMQGTTPWVYIGTNGILAVMFLLLIVGLVI